MGMLMSESDFGDKNETETKLADPNNVHLEIEE